VAALICWFAFLFSAFAALFARIVTQARFAAAARAAW
jgi:hypothetical protein